jgi:ADP-ribose pyrophosphatase YjhB (NUDIX family)
LIEFISKIKKAVVELLSLVPANRPLGSKLFNALARLTITFAFEVAIVRQGKNGPEVYVARRESNEAYANQWHVPGTALRPGETFAQAITRLCDREDLHIDQRPESLKVMGVFNHRHEERGHFVSYILLAEPEGDKMVTGLWVDIAGLSEAVIPHHRLNVIPRALTAFHLQSTFPTLSESMQEDDKVYPA